MRERKPSSFEPGDEPAANDSKDAPLSLTRLRKAFAAMLGEQGADEEPAERSRVSPIEDSPRRTLEVGHLGETAPRECEINPRSVVEAMLFVGRPDNGPVTAREIAATMRGVSPSEIDAAVSELNAVYERDESPYEIEVSPAGYRLALRTEFDRMRDKFYGRVREAKLSPVALEVLSILAYNQPASAEDLAELRGAPCGAALATLVRYRLARLERPQASAGKPTYSTTERFLKLFGLETLDSLPRSEELEKV